MIVYNQVRRSGLYFFRILGEKREVKLWKQEKNESEKREHRKVLGLFSVTF